MAIYSGKIHYKWWFSIVMLNYQRVKSMVDPIIYRVSSCFIQIIRGDHTVVAKKNAPIDGKHPNDGESFNHPFGAGFRNHPQYDLVSLEMVRLLY